MYLVSKLFPQKAMSSSLTVISLDCCLANWIRDLSWCSVVVVSGWKPWSWREVSCWMWDLVRLICLVRSFF